jgi:hypothetical protein
LSSDESANKELQGTCAPLAACLFDFRFSLGHKPLILTLALYNCIRADPVLFLRVDASDEESIRSGRQNLNRDLVVTVPIPDSGPNGDELCNASITRPFSLTHLAKLCLDFISQLHSSFLQSDANNRVQAIVIQESESAL